MAIINMTNKDGVTLKTAGKYCAEDITVMPMFDSEVNLQEKTATENGEVTADEGYDGLSKVTVEVSGDKSLVDRTITEISLPNVTKIGGSAFKGCIYLKTIHMPSVTSIEADAFNNCVELELTSLPDGVTDIGNMAFYHCRKLSLTSLPSSLTTIGTRAFYFCRKIIDISIPISVESIGAYAFSQCSYLTKVTFNGTPTSIDINAFAQCGNLTQINVPWAEGEVANAPWGATNATIIYNYSSPKHYLTFSSDEAFTIATGNATKNWDGTLYYSTDTETWSEWDGTTAISSAEHDGEQCIYMRGKGNSVITGSSSNAAWTCTVSNTVTTVACSGNIENLLDYETVLNGEHPAMSNFCFAHMFSAWRLTDAPELPATTLSNQCYRNMFSDCNYLATVPNLPATKLTYYCYYRMFFSCDGIKLSETQADEYSNEYRIPTSGTGTTASDALTEMFASTGGTFTGTPSINTTYYTSNTVV